MGVVQELTSDSGFTEVGDRVWVARYARHDVNVSVVAGSRGLLVLDTHSSTRAARGVIEDLRGRLATPVVAVVNSHEHFDHTFGNAAFAEAWPDTARIAHETAAARTVSAGERVQAAYRAEPQDPEAQGCLETELLAANTTFSSVYAVDLGERVVELIHPGRGHTGGDLVARVPDADLVLVGDLVEESAPPSYGADCYPLEWAASLDLVLSLIGPATRVVPGHGSVVDRGYVHDQRTDIGIVGETIRDAAARGLNAREALAQGEWPFPRERLEDAVRRGYAALLPGERRLPLV